MKLYELAFRSPNQLGLFEKCYSNLDSKRAYLGTFRPQSMTDETLSRMDCSDIRKFALIRQEVILTRLEERRKQEATRRHQNTLSNAELKLTDEEIQALQFNVKKLGNSGSPMINPCYTVEENVKASCSFLAEIYMSAAVVTSASNLVRVLKAPIETASAKIGSRMAPKGPYFPAIPKHHLGGRLIFKSKKDFPPVQPGYVRIYRSTGRPEVTQLSPSQRELLAKNPGHKPPRGDESFLSNEEGRAHAFGENNPDGISVTTDFDTAMNVASPTILIYDVPKEVFRQLPTGEPLLGERVFQYSIPDEYAKGVFIKPSPPTPKPSGPE